MLYNCNQLRIFNTLLGEGKDKMVIFALITNCYKHLCGLLLIVILSIAKNLNKHLKSIQRCFASLNMTFLETTFIHIPRSGETQPCW